MTTELYNKGLEYAVKLMKGWVFPFTEYDVVHDVIVENDFNEENDFFERIKKRTSENISDNRRTFKYDGTRETKFGSIIGDANVKLKNKISEWKLCPNCKEPKPEGCFRTIKCNTYGKVYKYSICTQCENKKTRMRHKKNKHRYNSDAKGRQGLHDWYIIKLLKKEGNKTITKEDITNKKHSILLKRMRLGRIN